MDILSRQTWGARDPKQALTPFTNSKLTHIVTHWPGDSRVLANIDSASLLRAWQKYHIDVRGWRDIGYNYAIDQAGRVWEGRGWNVGGHVLADENTRSVGFLFMLGNTEKPTDAMLNSAARLAHEFVERDKLGRKLDYVGHSDWANKVCPGPFIYPWTHAGMLPITAPLVAVTPLPVAPAPAPVKPPTKVGETSPAPVFPLGRCRAHNKQMWYGPKSSLDHQVSGWFNTQADGTKGSDNLAKWQRQMAYRGWKITPDGLWGDETERVCRAFQAEKGLVVDGKVGAKTWAMAWTAPIT